MYQLSSVWIARGVGTLLIGSSLPFYFYKEAISGGNFFRSDFIIPQGLLTTIACLAFVVGIGLWITSFDGRRGAWLRLDWFVPMLKRQTDRQRQSFVILAKWLRRSIPASWQSNWKEKRRGPVRRLLRRLGPTWLASPVRRVSQGCCLVAFLSLFFYACWPYDAEPRNKSPISERWSYVGYDQTRNLLEFSGPNEQDAGTIEEQATVHIAASTSGPIVVEEERLLGEFTVYADQRDTSERRLWVVPRGDLKPAMMDLMTGLQGGGETYSVYEHDPFAWPSHYADNLQSKEMIPAETFLMIDPLVSLSTAIAARSWVWSLASAAAILLVCIFIPRGFCGYLCPLGTTIDIFDWAIAGRVKRFQVSQDGWWVHIKYYLLAGILVAALFGVLVSGFFAAIPVITRGMLFIFDPLQNGVLRGWHLVPSVNAGQVLSIVLFLAVLSLGFFRPRFWCKYVCPSGAVFSVGNLFRATERKVESSCIHCNKCVEVCPFDAIKPDFTTRGTDCTLCQTCGGVCPTHAIKFVERWNVVELKVADDPPTKETAIGRRGFLSLATGSAAAVVGGSVVALGVRALGKQLGPSLPIVDNATGSLNFTPVRPPGSVPEPAFLQMCIRCGECFKACPNNVLQPMGFEMGLDGLWTPQVNANWAGCESSCNACGQVCPTGAIRAIDLLEKRQTRMGLAIVNEETCLPFAGVEACDLCVQECKAAGYHAIEYTQVGVEVDDVGHPIEGTGYAAPVVLADLCVGCGLCQTRCFAINVKDRGVLNRSAIIVEAGEGKEDRLMQGDVLSSMEDADHDSQSAEHKSILLGDPDVLPAEDPFGVDDPAGEASPF